MERRYDREFYSPVEENPPPKEEGVLMPEFGYPEKISSPKEIQPAAAEAPKTTSGDAIRTETMPARKKRRSITMAALTMIAAMSVTFVSLGLDPLGLSSDIVTYEAADSAFPFLTNLEPNGYVPTWGVLDEEYIMIESSAHSKPLYIYAGDAYNEYDDEGNLIHEQELTEYEGVSYDPDTNTLTLENAEAEVLNVNLMGNGFKIKLIGENRLDHLLIWGFYYGGSVTITGSGSLTVNESGEREIGIMLNAEQSQTCLMIDRDVTLDVYGREYAILVQTTTMDKAIYYLRPLVLTGGKRSKLTYEYEEEWQWEKEKETEHLSICDYTVLKDDGSPADHVTFSK